MSKALDAALVALVQALTKLAERAIKEIDERSQT